MDDAGNAVGAWDKHYQATDDFGTIARLIRQYGAEILQPGQLYRLQRWLDALPPDQVQTDAWLASQQGDFTRAVRLAERAIDILPESAHIWRGKAYIFLGEALAGEGRTADAIGANENGALDVLRRALAGAEPEGYVRTFVDFGQPMVSLLKQAVAQNIHPDYAAFLLTQFSQDIEPHTVSSTQHGMIEPLSAREVEVLTLLTTHMTGPEIADHLSISINTFKTHTRNIYGKLGVNRRNDAVVKAQELDLLSS